VSEITLDIKDKPPFGVKPRHLWLEGRASELIGAIEENWTAYCQEPDSERFDRIREWTAELSDLLDETGEAS
jgi:hypothetical protein